MLTEYAVTQATHQAKTGTDARGQDTHGTARTIKVMAARVTNLTRDDREARAAEETAYLTTAEVNTGDLLNGRRIIRVSAHHDFNGALVYRKAVTD